MYETFKILECVKNEICEAEEYIKLAHEFKTIYPPTSRLFLDLSKNSIKTAKSVLNYKNNSYNLKEVSKDKDEHDEGNKLWKFISPGLNVQIATINREIDELEQELK